MPYNYSVILLITTTLAALVSLGTNVLAETMSKPISVIRNFAVLSLSHNPGIAFGIHLPSPFKEILIGLALLLVCIAAYKSRHEKWSALAFGLIIGGAAANLIDRISDGLVTDYVAIGTFPVFNAADACITVGAVLLILESLLHRKKVGSNV